MNSTDMITMFEKAQKEILSFLENATFDEIAHRVETLNRQEENFISEKNIFIYSYKYGQCEVNISSQTDLNIYDGFITYAA